ncbi:hypothetical protein BKA66DRAFT_416504 [Pyrenochaeta sp. MPI-SDFR-AT-0127]|nr:hypothetical protein BKA66DRAFT_416504 [Pyrenochaeta sp. MPI-SDFR-AT-0127]
MESKQSHAARVAPPTSLLDPIVEATHEFIQKERRHNYLFLGKHSHRYKDQQELLVARAADSDEINMVRNRAGYDETSGYDNHWYTFSEPLCMDGVLRTVVINHSPGKEIVVDNLSVICFSNGKAAKRTYPLAQWLRDVYVWDNEYDMRFKDMQYDEQRLWWDTNGMTFRLLDLPAEMREAIYLQNIGPVVVPKLRSVGNLLPRVTLGFGSTHKERSRDGSNRDPDVHRPNMNIMRVSKQVMEEATRIAYSDTTKRFRALGGRGTLPVELGTESPSLVHTILAGVKNFSPHATFLRHVQLEMSAVQYFSFIGFFPTVSKPLRRVRPGLETINMLKTFSALQDLDFRFISPKHPDAVCPWHLASGGNGNEKHSCQKVWIDFFFVFAFRSLKTLQDSNQALRSKGVKGLTFSLSGCVKNSTRKYWQRVLNDTSICRLETIASREHQMISDKKDAEPIPCACQTPCMRTDALAQPEWSEYEIRNIVGLQEELDKVYWDFED